MRRVVAAVLIGVVLLAAVAAGIALLRPGDDHPVDDLTVGWGGDEEHPACVYDAQGHRVDAAIAVDGSVARRQTVTVTVAAYADENTSDPVGSGSRSVEVEGTVHLPLRVTVPVDRPPHVDEDGVVACALDVQR